MKKIKKIYPQINISIMKNFKFKFSLLLALSVVVFLSFSINSADAATRTWTGTASNLWNVDANWGGTKPVAGDDLVFPVSASNKSTSNNFTFGTSFNSITFEGTGYTLASTGITLSAGGITSNSGGANTISLAIALSADTTINTVNVNDNLTISGVISEAFVLNKTGVGQLTLSGNNSFSGGLVVKAGTLSALTSGGSLGGNGTGTVTLGNSAGGSDDATLWVSASITFANPIVLASNTTGTLAIAHNALYPVISGGVTGNNNLTLMNNGGTTLTLSGGTVNNSGTVTNASTGSGGVTISSVIGTNVTGVIQNSSSVTMTLSGTNTFTSGVTVLKGAVFGSNNASAFGTATTTLGNSAGGSDDAKVYVGGSSLTYANPIELASNTTGTLTIGSSSCNSPVTLSGGVTGNNDFTIEGTTCGFRTLNFTTGSLNNAGTITHATVPTTDTITISAIIGSNVTEFINNSGGIITLSGDNADFSGGVTILKGTVSGATSANAFGTGSVTIGNSAGGSDDAALRAGTTGLTFANPIVLASNTTGTLQVTNGSCVHATFTGGVTGTNNFTISSSGCSRTITFSTGTISNVGTVTATTVSAAGSITINSVIGSSVTGVIANFSNTTDLLNLFGNNADFAGGVTILKGTVNAGTSANALGTGTVTIGNSAGGSDDATLVGYGDLTYSNPIVLAANTTGILKVANRASGTCTNPIFTGGITGNNNVTFQTGCSKTLTFSSGSIDNTGSVTVTITNAGFANIDSIIGSNVSSLIINGATLTLSGDNSTISGDVTITSGTLQLSGTTNLNVSGGWSNSGTFTANQSTVTLTTGSHTISGANTFYNLTLNPSNTVTFATTTTQTISNNFSCSGTAGNTITINSSEVGTQATLSKSSGTVDCDYLLLTDSDATGGATWNAGDNSIKYDNVTGWLGGSAGGGGDGGSGGTIINIVKILIRGGMTFKGGITF